MINRKIIGFVANVVLVAGLCSCSNDRVVEVEKTNPFQEISNQFPTSNRTTQIITIDSCEYIVWEGSHGEIGYAHKGNCKLCRLRQPCH
jgi:hypothetical protein